MDFELVRVNDVGDHCVRISLDRPGARNAQSRQLLTELDHALAAAVDDPEVRVIILAGAGDHFSAGHDLKEAQANRAGFTVEERWAYETRYYYDYTMRIWNCPKPVIAQVQGACVAAGFMIAAVCDLMVASDDAFFSDPVVHTLGASAVEVLVHPWALGLRQAKDLLFTGRRISAQEAFRMGMVNRLVPRAELEAAAIALAGQIAKAPPFAVALTKRSLNRTAEIQGFKTAIDAHFDTHQLSHVSEGFKAARDAGLSTSIQRGSGNDRGGS